VTAWLSPEIGTGDARSATHKGLNSAMTQSPDIPAADGQSVTAERFRRAREAMAENGIDMLLVTPSADLQYLASLGTHASERPTILAISATGESALIAPQFEVPLARHLTEAPILPYTETQDPYALLAESMPPGGSESVIAVSDRTWSSFLLRLQTTYPGAKFQSASSLLSPLRMIKSQAESQLLAQAGSMADAAFTRIVNTPFAGQTELQVAARLIGFLNESGLDTSGWDPIIASGPNSASPHNLTGDREIREGDAVVLDFGGSVQGYKADMTRTVHVGTPGDEFRRVYDVVRRAQETGVNACRAGATAEGVDAATREVIAAAGYGAFFLHRTGHGIGLDVHEAPYIVSGNTEPIQPGMAFSIEPGIYLEGRFGVRIEDIVLVTEQGAQRLNTATHDLVTVA
jgi:Xaa-Pro aminopeptidase